MNIQRPPRKHHYVPQFWTKNWSGQDNRVQRFTKPHPGVISSLRKHPSEVGWHYRLYELPSLNEESLDFETLFFKKVDQAASDLFDRLKFDARVHLSAFESETLAVFLISLLHRSPAALQSMIELSRIMESDVREELRPRYEEIRGANDPSTVEEYEAELGPTPHLRHVSSVFSTVIASSRLASFLVRLSWRRIMFSDDEHNLLLSDDPLIRTNGIAQQTGHLAFPLTPKIAIFGVFDGGHFESLFNQPIRNIVTQMNIQAAESARHFVVDIDERQLRFIRNRFGKNLRPTLSESSLNSLR